MERIMEFILNLLLIKLKFAKSATKTVNEAIRRCLKFKSKIESEYNKATNKVYPYDSLEIMNYNASHYVGEAENCIVTREIPFDLYEKVRKGAKAVCSKPAVAENPMASDASSSKLVLVNPPAPVVQPDGPKSPLKCDDYIVENLHGILKSQELLFKNITKLINILEKDKLDASNVNLVKLKKKIQACANILSNQPVVYNVIEDLIEQEIVRCRLKVGVGQTSNEMTLNPNKTEKLQGLAVVTQKVHRMKSHIAHKASTPLKDKIELWQKKYECFNKTVLNTEAIEHSMSLSNLQKLIPSTQKCSHSTTDVARLKRGGKKHSQAELEECKKLVNVVTNYFNEFENLLWHKTTTSKYLSIKNDYENMCKCGFKNKRHFLLVESQILKRLEQQRDLENIEKMLVVNDSMFQLIERKLLFKNRSNDLKLFIDDLHQQKQTEKTFHQVPAAIEQINNNEPRIFALNNNSRLIGSKSIKPSLTLNSLKTFRVDGNNVSKFMQSRYDKIPQRINNGSLFSSFQTEKLMTRFLPEKIAEEAEKVKNICIEQKQIKPVKIAKRTVETKPESILVDKELTLSTEIKNQNYVSEEEIENAANLLTANKTAFEEMENVINVIRIFNDLKPPVTKSKQSLKAAEEPTAAKNEVTQSKTKALEVVQPKLSPVPPPDDVISADFLLNRTKKFKSDEQITFQSIREVAKTYIKLTNSSAEVSSTAGLKQKNKTFLLDESPPSESMASSIDQTSTYRQILANIKRKEEARQIRPKKSSTLLQRTTKTAIKKEQASLAPPASVADKKDSRASVQKSSSASEHTSSTKQNYAKSSSTRGKEEVGKPSASGGRHQRNLSNSASTSLIFTKNSGEQFMWQAQDEKKFVRNLFNDAEE